MWEMCNWEKVCRGCWYGFVNLIERRREVSAGGYHTCLIWFCLVVSEIGGEEFKRLCQAIFVAYQMDFVHAREMRCVDSRQALVSSEEFSLSIALFLSVRALEVRECALTAVV